MTIFNFVFGVICLSILCSLEIEAATLTFTSSEPKTTYLEKGRTLNLNVSYQYDGNQAVSVTWSFNKSVIIRAINISDPIINADPLRAKIVGLASFQLVNTDFSDNGTFTVNAYAADVTTEVTLLNFEVIIQVRPVANISCATPVNFTKGENFSCICSGVDGSPPPTAYWFKDNNSIPITKGYLTALLDIKNASTNYTGTYTCRVQSGNLIDEQRVNVAVLHEPTSISFTSNVTDNTTQVGEYVKLTAQADGNPKPNYKITFVKNQTFEEVLNNIEGILIIKNVKISDNGTYRCVAKNNFGGIEAELFLNVMAKTTQSTTTRSTTTPTSSTNETTGSSSKTSPVTPTATSTTTNTSDVSDDKTTLYAGIGGACACVCLCGVCYGGYRYHKKRSASGSGGHEEQGNIVERPMEGNPYECVDAAKIEQARAAEEAGPSNENPPCCDNSLPPVYAVVDKSKKTPKPPPEKPPADSLTYASLDPVQLQPDSSKMRARTREDTTYASINLEKL